MRDPYELKKNPENQAVDESQEPKKSMFSGFFGGSEEPQSYAKKKPKLKKQNRIQVDTSAFENLSEIKGIYLFGGPGSGKTFLMDLFMTNMQIQQKRRVHYAEFMLNIHRMIHKNKKVTYFLKKFRLVFRILYLKQPSI